jgi:catechol 2,3-dioxygenase-like lactoylglutathione lyase family enzyme
MRVSDVERAATFWSSALGFERQPGNASFLLPAGVPEGTPGTRLHLDGEDRTHLDLWAEDEADQQAQVERLISLGARRVDWEYPADADFIVLADPDGNLFCVIA